MLPAHQPLDCFRELAHLVAGVAGADRLRDAVLGVVAKEQKRHTLQGRLDRGHLGEHVHAVALPVDHPAQAANLPSMRLSLASICCLSFT